MDTSIATSNETKIYQDNNILVASSRLQINNKTFAMRNIASVSMRRVVPSHSIEFFLLLLSFILSIINPYIGLGAILFILIIMARKPIKFSLVVLSNSGESKVLESKDKKYVQLILDALNTSIVMRG